MRGQRVSSESKKADLVVVAARYSPEGFLHRAQVYERIGEVWSDLLLISREELLDRVCAGARVVTGKPIGIPGDFRINASVGCERVNDMKRLTLRGRSHEGEALGVPLF